MKYRITHSTRYQYSQAVPVCHNLVHLCPRELPSQSRDSFALLIHPEPTRVTTRQDYFGNDVSLFSIDHPHSGMTVTSLSEMTVTARPVIDPKKTAPWEKVAAETKSAATDEALDAYQFVFDSIGVKRVPELLEYVQASFSAGRPILAGVLELTERINKEFRYDPRATTVHTEVREVFENRHGVCQDFAHLQIGCLRTLGIAARYVSGYLRTLPPPGKPRLVGADASHAWLSVYCGEAGWIDVDPTNNLLVSSDHVSVAWGRDYFDVCPIQGTIVGGGQHSMTISVDVAPIADEPVLT
ncbi:Protein-glutamine gamma-glutamyltransferase [Polystyrenella longa]|uniref:Protein-glutamine gamma-glutamyltransferase n=1 Tax=Polystyrenella longa TaxID=2528007 RepID=A0A518CU25_9PLAN|nr:transglutaminase family protein [Polystyrenella longa]QDU82732.1 Protein-glutamine gamma-glutamyltransferase [Polystyrenella longa]